MKILILNAGSSSLKFELFEALGKKLKSLHKGHFDNHEKQIVNFETLVKNAIKNMNGIQVVGHRVVHGG